MVASWKGYASSLEAAVDARRARVEVTGHFHLERLVRPLVVVLVDKGIEAGLLLEDIGGGGFGRFLFERQMHPLMSAVLLRLPGAIRSR